MQNGWDDPSRLEDSFARVIVNSLITYQILSSLDFSGDHCTQITDKYSTKMETLITALFFGKVTILEF